MAIPGHEFLTAHFSNNERTIVESYWVTPDGKETRVEYVEANPEDTAWKKLLTHIDIDALHENTYKHIREQSKVFAETAIKIAEDEGILKDYKDKNVINNVIVDMLFNEDDTSESKNELFIFKLKLFESDFIKKCENRELKSDLRKALNMRQALKVAIEIFEQSN